MPRELVDVLRDCYLLGFNAGIPYGRALVKFTHNCVKNGKRERDYTGDLFDTVERDRLLELLSEDLKEGK